MRCDPDSTKVFKAVWVHALKGLALPRVSHSDEIAMSDLRRVCSMLVVDPVIFAHDVVTVSKSSGFQDSSVMRARI